MHVLIEGRVQGVFYRKWMQSEARTLGVSGWVRNCADGRVEAVVAGEREAVEALLERCHDGPPAANVESVLVSPTRAPDGEGFEVR